MLVTFEGIEGSGKSTQAGFLAGWLRERGFRVLLTREPGGSPLGAKIREILLDAAQQGLTGEAELFLYLADRAQHVAGIIRPALQDGGTVIVDRYIDSTIAYQGYGRGIELSRLRGLNDMASGALLPDLTFLLDLEEQKGLSRALQRNREHGTTDREGRFEAESLRFHHNIRRGYLDQAAANPQRIATVDADRPAEDVFAEIAAVMRNRFRL
jgi:dTMP kinase